MNGHLIIIHEIKDLASTYESVRLIYLKYVPIVHYTS